MDLWITRLINATIALMRVLAIPVGGILTDASKGLYDGSIPYPIEYKWAIPILGGVLFQFVIMLAQALAHHQCNLGCRERDRLKDAHIEVLLGLVRQEIKQTEKVAASLPLRESVRLEMDNLGIH